MALTLRRRSEADEWHMQPNCPRWPKDNVPTLEEIPAPELARGSKVCKDCVKIAGSHRGRRGGWH